MQKVLIVTDMQNDFIDGALGTKEAIKIVPHVISKIKSFKGTVLYTRDTHDNNYLKTQEGKKLPVVHCQKGTNGWMIQKDIDALRKTRPIDKEAFGSLKLVSKIKELNKQEPINTITFVGLCTDICVISNAFVIKASFPEIRVIVDAKCCAGVTPKTHKNALEAMKVCQIEIINE